MLGYEGCMRRYQCSVEGYDTVQDSFLQVWQAMIGYPQLDVFFELRSKELGGPVLLLLFQYVFVFFVGAMLITIVSDAYDKVYNDFLESGAEVSHLLSPLVWLIK